MNSFGFVPSVPLWTIGLALLLVATSVWFEIRKKIKFRLARIVAVVFIGISVLGFLLRPFYEIRTAEEIILLTPGFKTSQVDSITRLYSHFKLMRTRECEDVKNAMLVDDNFFEKKSASIRMILGEGLSSALLETMPRKNFQFTSPQPEGIVKLFFTDDVVENHKSTLKGVANCNTDTRLRLIGPAGAEDSVQFKKGNNQYFSLSFLPKQKGKFVYMVEVQSEANISKEPWPIDVLAEHPLKILFVEKFPTAETKNLKNFLGEKHHSITVRHQVSREAFSYEFINAPESKIKSISRGLLSSFDLLFLNSASLNSLSQTEKTELKAAVRDGLGIVIMLSEEPKNLQWLWSVKFKSSAKDTAHIQLEKKYTLPVLTFEVENYQEKVYSLSGSGSKTLSGYTLHGNGKIAFTRLQETYRIKVEGNEKDYSTIWTDLISKTSRRKTSDLIQIKTSFPVYPNEPVDVDVLTQMPESFLNDSIPIALKEDLAIDDFWHSRIWAGQPGWHELKTNNTSLNYFVAPENSWASLRATNRILETQKASVGKNIESSQSTERKEISLLVFFLLFLISAGFLWLAPKLG